MTLSVPLPIKEQKTISGPGRSRYGNIPGICPGLSRNGKCLPYPYRKTIVTLWAQLLTYMQTVRFLTDYLNGDTYYKIQYPEHNLQRTLAQLTHLHSIDSHLEEMNAWINQLSNQ